MPQIIVKEYDKSKIVNGQYNNFTVVVPGFVAADKSTSDWNEGIYEFTSQKEFEEKVGCIDSVTVEAKCATVEDTEVTEIVYYKNIFNKTVFEATEITDEDEKVAGKDKYVEDETWYQLTPVEVTETDVPDFDPSKIYKLCKAGNRGNDATTSNGQYGNQIAYELLGLGYTVLYKEITNIADLNEESFWEPLKDKATYDFRYVITGLARGNEDANDQIYKLAAFSNAYNMDIESFESTGRGDCFALMDIDELTYETASSQKEAYLAIQSYVNSYSGHFDINTRGKYGAFFAPSVYLEGLSNKYTNKKLPASFYYLACASKAFESYNEWYAVAGYTRGISNYTVTGTYKWKFGEAAINCLQPRNSKQGTKYAVNLVVKIKDSYYLWGNRTAYELRSEEGEDDLKWSHFLNIRQLCSTIKKQVYVTCRRYTFDPNSDVLWTNICQSLKPMLDTMKSDQGIADYKIIKVKSTQKAKLRAKIRIVPIEAVEDFDIGLYLEDSIDSLAITEADE